MKSNNNQNKSNINKMFKIFSMLFLAVSLMFVIPINLGFAADVRDSSVSPTNSAATLGDAKNTCGLGFNVKDSFIMSAITLCIPGILEKIQELQQLECEAVVCRYNAVLNGIDDRFCNDQKEYKVCKFWVGEIFAIPPLAIIEMIKNFVAEIIANPVGILYSAATIGARNFLSTACMAPEACSGFVVIATAFFLFIVDITGVAQTLSDLIENGFTGNQGPNYCEQARDIKKELQEVVDEYDKLNGGYY